MKIKINNETKEYKEETTIFEISKDYIAKEKYPILAAYVNNELCDLNKKISNDCTIEFVNYSSRVGSRIYQKALIFLISYAVKQLYSEHENIRVCHSIDKGIRIKTNFNLDEKVINKLIKKINEIITRELPFKKLLVSRKEAMKYFESISDFSKVLSLKYTTNHYINLYQLGDIYDYMYSIMPHDTNVLKDYKLTLINNHELILRYPSIVDDLSIPEYINRPKMLEAYNENYELAKRLDIFNVCDLNKAISNGKINDIIKLNDVVSNGEMLKLSKEIFEKKDKVKIVLIAGPSSSAKTTTSRKLSMYLKTFGLNPKPLSIDDYFLEREETPKLPNGEYDFESIDAIDLKLFNDHLTKLLNNEEISAPTYNFYTGCKEYKNNKIKLDANDILIIEGLHGLNEKLTNTIPKEKKYKIYVSPLTDLNMDNHNMISTSDVRLLRRIVRDNRTRGYNAEHTIEKWPSVRAGEEKYVFPFQDEADCVFNSSFIYEVGVLKLYAMPLLYEVKEDSQSYEEARRLINFLLMFLAIPADKVPEDSLLREFIGESYFERR